jgi:hypothetical protein
MTLNELIADYIAACDERRQRLAIWLLATILRDFGIEAHDRAIRMRRAR